MPNFLPIWEVLIAEVVVTIHKSNLIFYHDPLAGEKRAKRGSRAKKRG